MRNKDHTFTSVAILAVAFLLALACTKVAPPNFVKYNGDGDVPRVSVQDAKAEIDAGTAIMVDSRPEFAFKHERIKGAFSIPIGSPPEKFSELPQGKKIFIYCS
ncbi:MAG TPA: rhodanese-like domain-containing protein [Pyrinomonadaceae bacterium]|nr:rhodanese-like domain-containing protein [Pyrinomonadaceae bacterium]